MEESITLVSLIPEERMDGYATPDQVVYVLSSALHLKDFVNPLLTAAKKYIVERTMVDIQTWFRITSTTEFLSQVSVMVEGRGPTSNIKLFRAALYLYTKEFIKAEDIRAGITAFTVFERQNLFDGVPRDQDLLMKMVRSSGKFIPVKLLALWLHQCSDEFNESGKVSIWEFLFLLANTQDRRKTITEKLPHSRMKLEKDSNRITYKLDAGLNHNRSPDFWLQKITNAQIDVKRVHFTAEKKKLEKADLRTDNKKKVKIARNSSSHLELKTMLRNPELFKEIKESLVEAKTLLKKSRLGTTSYKALPTQDNTFLTNFAMAPGEWARLMRQKRPATASTINKRTRPMTAESDFFHLTSGVQPTKPAVPVFSSRPRIDRPLTAGTHHSSTKTALELVIKTEPFQPLNIRQATMLNLRRSYSNT